MSNRPAVSPTTSLHDGKFDSVEVESSGPDDDSPSHHPMKSLSSMRAPGGKDIRESIDMAASTMKEILSEQNSLPPGRSPAPENSLCAPPTLGAKTMTFRRLHTGVDNHMATSQLSDAEKRRGALGEKSTAELTQVAYSKDVQVEGEHFQKKIMKRVFDSLDPTHSGKLNEKDLELFFKKVGSGTLTEDEYDVARKVLCSHGPPTFEHLWECWTDEKLQFDTKSSSNFKLLSSKFAESFNQHQLLVREEGEKFTPEYRVWFYLKSLNSGEERVISPWHDIPLHVKDVIRTDNPSKPLNKYNFICEIPKWTRAKFEIATIEPFNPIKQDVSKGALRFYKHGDMLFNYGAFPQTWESTEHSFVFTEGDQGEAYKGDNDPVDAIEIGTQQLTTGSVTAVKVLGCLGMIDEGEMDWKVVVISLTDPLAMFMDDITDVNRYMPGALDCLRVWLRDYKICTGKPENRFVFDGEYFPRDYAKDVIRECHNHWRKFHLITERGTV
eukprot:TRINITY_DN7460_c0_g1_i1.p1 TRINITY_DN7460_c0_g1~~TRINITY_DN7460_c0_g1_i1.p1  ORF type:complete len:497 (+),score=198.16 TRINITY_DN7460_c0_g1_i1:51-1541(+)